MTEIYCFDCGAFIGTIPISINIGKDFFCADCGMAKMNRIMSDEKKREHKLLMDIQQAHEDALFTLMRTNRGVCTYTP